MSLITSKQTQQYENTYSLLSPNRPQKNKDETDKGIKRIREDVNNYSNIPQLNDLAEETVLKIIDSFRKRDLDSIGLVGKHFKKIADKSKMWEQLFNDMKRFGSKIEPLPSHRDAFLMQLKNKNVCALLSKIYFEHENKYAKTNIDSTLNLIINIQKNYKYSCELSKELLLMKGDFYIKKGSFYSPVKQAMQCYHTAQCLVPLEIDKALNNLLKAKCGYLELGLISDDEIFDILQSIKKFPVARFTRIEAELYDCLMALDKRRSFYDEIGAINHLKSIFNNEGASIDQRALAAYYLARAMKRAGKTFEENEYIKYIQNDPDVSRDIIVTTINL